MSGIVVIGKLEMDEAPMLYINEKVGTNKGDELDIAVDPLEGTNFTAKNLPNALFCYTFWNTLEWSFSWWRLQERGKEIPYKNLKTSECSLLSLNIFTDLWIKKNQLYKDNGDEIIVFGKGEAGGDRLQKIKKEGIEIGRILYERKQTKGWVHNRSIWHVPYRPFKIIKKFTNLC